ncbi:MAG TPA: hypothetical protein VFB54_07270 [Burkholderiales bacterium]|nr:hypothetical protein [Burkholderiales bacterium]
MFIGPCYILKNNGVSISTAITVAQLKAGTNGAIEILRSSLTQGSVATSAQYAAALLLKKTAAATVTAATAGTHLLKQNAVNPTSDASLGTSATGITGTAEGTDGEITITRGFNDLNGAEWLATPEERILIAQSGICAQKYLVAPQSATRYSELAFRELRAS